MAIHPNAVVDPKAEIGPNVEIGPFAIVEGPVQIGEGTRIYPNAYVSGWTTIGRNCQIHPNAIVGHVPQDFHFTGERSYCRIGDGTIIRECSSVHRGTQPESVTEVGRECFILGYVHIGHNCVLGDRVKIYNGTLVAGHAEIGSDAIISGHCLLHQFVRVGERVMAGAASTVFQDVPPFMAYVTGLGIYGLNTIGLRRAGLPNTTIRELGEIYKLLFRSGKPLPAAIEAAAALATTPEAKHVLAFCRAPSKRGIDQSAASKRSRVVDDADRAAVNAFDSTETAD